MSISKINGETIIAERGGGYSLRGTLAGATSNPAGATSYYGGASNSTYITTTADTRRIYIPKAGTIKSCYGFFNQIGSTSGNTGTLYIRLNDTTDYQVGTAQAHNVTNTVYSSTSLSIEVTQGNYIEFRWLSPTGNFQPKDMTSSFIVYIE